MTESERAVIPQQTGPPSFFFSVFQERSGEDRGEKGGMDYWRAVCICLIPFLFILLVCFFFPSSSPTPPPAFLPPSSTHFHFALFEFLAPPPPPSLFSPPLCLPREKRFCLLLVSAPSQSAFLISSYCFCLIFKCYPGPNGNPYKKKSEGREGREEKPAGYCVSLQDRETKAPPPSTITPLRERFGRFWGTGVGRGERVELGLEDGSQVQSKRGDIFLWCLLAPCITL